MVDTNANMWESREESTPVSVWKDKKVRRGESGRGRGYLEETEEKLGFNLPRRTHSSLGSTEGRVS